MEAAGDGDQAALPAMNFDLFNIPFKFFGGDKEKEEKEKSEKETERRKF